MRYAIALLVLLLSACAGSRQVIHEPVTVTRYVYVPIRSDLTRHPATIPDKRNDSGAELLRVAKDRGTELWKCYGQLDAIGIVQGTEAPTP